MGMNFNTLLVPPWLLIFLGTVPLLFSVLSYGAFLYFLFRFWDQYGGGERTLKVSGLIMLSFTVMMHAYILYRIVSSYLRQAA